jgi:prevent-host-death family protein
MRIIAIEAAQSQLSELLEAAASGEEIVIERAGTPIVRMVPVASAPSQPRQLGSLRGKYAIPDDFDASLPDWLLDAFEGR